MTANSLPKAVQDCHTLLIWLIPLLDNFPRNRRFTLGERLESGMIEILELLVEAAYVTNKRDVLKLANRRLAVVRHLWRMAYELQTIPAKRYEQGARLLEELGKQVGGWLKSVDTP
ncbi:MAG: diversity-generating retroelement protein Avd [Methylococcales bacterium]|nr:diversity-generating retroelement protein Avd [Methylococcales bacterium]MDD5632540.1 diversity-generating retroelement protein Avd [Methylococcales bacterium]